MANTLWCGDENDKLYLQNGEFEANLLDSEDVTALGVPRAVGNTLTDTLWATSTKFYKLSGKITSTIKTSHDVSGISTVFTGLATDLNMDIIACSRGTSKFYNLSGIFTSTIKTSLGVTWGAEYGISIDEYDNTFYCDNVTDKVYYLSGKFTSTVKSSLPILGLGENHVRGVSTNGVDTFWAGDGTNQLRRYSGKITSTLKDAQDINGFDSVITGMESDNIADRLDLWVGPANLAASDDYLKSTITFDAVGGAESYNLYWATSGGVTQYTGTKIEGIISGYEFVPPPGQTYGINYYFVVTAYSVAKGESFDSSEVDGVPYRLDFTLKQDLAFEIHALTQSPTTGYMFAGCDNGRIFRSTDGGTNWAQVSATNGIQISSMCCTPNGYIYSGHTGGRLYYSTDNGANFSQNTVNGWRSGIGSVDPFAGEAIQTLYPVGNTVYISGQFQAGWDVCLTYTNDFGSTYQKVSNFGVPIGTICLDIEIGGDGKWYAAVHNDLLRQDTGVWTSVSPGMKVSEIRRGGRDDTELFAVGESSDLLRHSIDNGDTWSTFTSAAMSATVKGHDIVSSYGLVYVAVDSSDGRVYMSDENETTFENSYVFSGMTAVQALLYDCTNGVFIVGSESNIFKAPITPANAIDTLAAVAGVREVDLTWDIEPGAISYTLYWSLTPGVTKITGTPIVGVTSPYTHTIPTPGPWEVPYYYVITSIGCGGESNISNEVSATPQAGVPDTPLSLTADATSTSIINITWDAAIGATSYNLYWGLTPGISLSDFCITGIAGTTYDHGGRMSGIVYYYKVVAVGPIGNSGLSLEDNAVCPFDIAPFQNMLWHLLPKGRFWQK